MNNIEIEQAHWQDGHEFVFRSENVSEHETKITINYLLKEEVDKESTITTMRKVQEQKSRPLVKNGVPVFEEAKAKIGEDGKIVTKNGQPVMEDPKPVMEDYLEEVMKPVQMPLVTKETVVTEKEVDTFGIYSNITPAQLQGAVENYFLVSRKLQNFLKVLKST